MITPHHPKYHATESGGGKLDSLEWRASEHTNRYVCAIPIQNGKVVYMCSSWLKSSEKAIVVCNPRRFLDMWRLYGSQKDEIPLDGDWSRHYKFKSADKKFSDSEKIPVSLADVSFGWYVKPEKYLSTRLGQWKTGLTANPILGFCNGITRTSWLLHNRAEYFPVECTLQEASALYEAVGIGDDPFAPISFR